MILMIDNYEDLVKNTTDSEKSNILAGIDKRLFAWVKDSSAVLRKYDRDKYIFVIESAELDKLVARKFSVLQEVREIENHEGVVATLSIGIGRDGETLAESYQFAGLAIDMALSRGGDQAVIKNKFNFAFFGGRSKETERRTKVKSRVVANALSQLIRDSSQVLVMGHKNSDMDAIGAAAGMVCAARVKGRPVHIVVDRQHTMASDLIERLETQSEYKGVFISAEDAMIACDFNTLLIVVDVNRPGYVESAALLEIADPVELVAAAGESPELAGRMRLIAFSALGGAVCVVRIRAGQRAAAVSCADQRHSHLRGGSHAGRYLSGYQGLFNAHRRPHI